MKKKYYTAKVIWLNEENKKIETVIYSFYQSIEKANEGIKRFCEKGYNVIKAWVA